MLKCTTGWDNFDFDFGVFYWQKYIFFLAFFSFLCQVTPNFIKHFLFFTYRVLLIPNSFKILETQNHSLWRGGAATCWGGKHWPQHCFLAVNGQFSPAEVQWSPPGLAASRRLFRMLTLVWGVESPVDVSEVSRAAAGVEERTGARGVAKNGISFSNAGVRKVDSSEDLLGSKNKKN